MAAVEVRRSSFIVVDAKRILYYWASTRNLNKDVIYETRAEKEIKTR